MKRDRRIRMPRIGGCSDGDSGERESGFSERVVAPLLLPYDSVIDFTQNQSNNPFALLEMWLLLLLILLLLLHTQLFVIATMAVAVAVAVVLSEVVSVIRVVFRGCDDRCILSKK
ncbi:hypothetical protein R6Q59_015564 [Mikania micrantha]